MLNKEKIQMVDSLLKDMDEKYSGQLDLNTVYKLYGKDSYHIVIEYELVNEISHGIERRIVIAPNGRKVISIGLEKYLQEITDKANKETELHVFAKETNDYSKSIKVWTIRAFWAIVIIGLAGIVATLYTFYFGK